MATAAAGAAHRLRHLARDSSQLFSSYLKLSKYRLSGLVAFTAGVGYVLRHEPAEDDVSRRSDRFWRELSAVTAGTWLAGASANTLNQMYEIRSDALMARTRLRPLPSGRLGLAHAALFAAATGAAGVGLLASETNEVAAGLGAANIALYAGAYTPLKRLSPVNTWVGAVVGAIPPMLGWAAASDGCLTGERERGAWMLGNLLFLWQIPHFHALAVVARRDYAVGGLRMLAVSDPAANARWAGITAAALVPAGAGFAFSGVTTDAFAWENAALSWWMYRGARRLAENPASVAAARPLFKASILHLPAVMCLMVAHRRKWSEVEEERVRDKAWREGGGEVRVMQPWEMMAPFPFLPPVVACEMRKAPKGFEK